MRPKSSPQRDDRVTNVPVVATIVHLIRSVRRGKANFDATESMMLTWQV